MKKYLVYFNDNDPLEFNDVDSATDYYSQVYKLAKKLWMSDEKGIILAKKLEN